MKIKIEFYLFCNDCSWSIRTFRLTENVSPCTSCCDWLFDALQCIFHTLKHSLLFWWRVNHLCRRAHEHNLSFRKAICAHRLTCQSQSILSFTRRNLWQSNLHFNFVNHFSFFSSIFFFVLIWFIIIFFFFWVWF